MFENVNTDSAVAVYVQIENQVRFAIASGELKPGDRLPSVWDVAKQVGINANTIAKAYRDLAIMDLVTARRGVGVFVKDGAVELCRERCLGEVAGKVYEASKEAQAAGLARKDVRKLTGLFFKEGGPPYSVVPKHLFKEATDTVSKD